MKPAITKQNFALLTLLTTLAVLIASYYLVESTSFNQLISDLDSLTLKVRQMGSIGPLVIIGLMMLAVVISPLPSAPIALVSGAVFGHTFGTIYIIVGAGLGAFIAFFIARLAGLPLVSKMIGDRISLKQFDTQNSLMAVVFISRLIPFLSFDLVSYAAGLTPISFWRFAIATVLGLIPASFLLAHFGGEMIQFEFQNMMLFVLIVGLVTILPMLFSRIRNKFLTRVEK
jgi:uncharacterized membrane protein YdjX (TVP38/TMEM64 family)